jgi:hypothetical protein
LLGSAAQNKEGEGRREQASVARASRPPGRKGKEGKFTHFIFFLFSIPFSKMDFESKTKEIKTTAHNNQMQQHECINKCPT